MPSKILRRSGVAIVNIAELLDWRPDLVIQVGVGQHHQEVDVMREAWPGVRLVGYDPNPCQDYPGEFLQVAISSMNGALPFYAKPRHADGSTLLFETPDGSPHWKTVEVRTLDTLYRRNDFMIDQRDRVLLWLDCEGSELGALVGGRLTLQLVDVVNVELTSKPPSKYWPSPVEVHNHLMNAGFLRQSVHTNRSSSGQCDCIYVRRSLFRPEYCCCPCMLSENTPGPV